MLTGWLAGWCRVLALVMDELVQTETDYVVALNYVVDHYMPQIQLDSVPQPLRGKRTVVFGNLQNIAQFHTDRFLADISAACRLSAFQLGATFLRHVRTTPTLGHHSLNHSLRTSQYAERLEPRFRSIVPSQHWQTQKTISRLESGYYSALSNDVIHDVIHDAFVLFTICES